jgi:4-amino-4-deoxy-L-arabinose transferase-like glycosyltransferase
MGSQFTRSGGRSFYIFLVAALIGIGCLRIAATYPVFSQTWDEPAHIAAGMEWLEQGAYTLEPMHPPLARIMAALGLYLQGARLSGGDQPHTMWAEGNALLQAQGQYQRNLAVARLGILPFFILAALVTAGWALRLRGRLASLLAVFLFTTLPPVLGHAGLATTDMAAAALTTASFFTFTLWLARPTPRNGLLFGLAVGLAALAKFTTLYFLAAGIGLAFLLFGLPALRRRGIPAARLPSSKDWLITLSLAILTGALTLWAGYRFSTGTLLEPANQPFEQVDRLVGGSGGLHDLAYFVLGDLPLPAPEFFLGIYSTLFNNQEGRTMYLLGEVSSQGRWYFYPVVFFFKTPLPFFFLALAGLVWVLRGSLHRPQERMGRGMPVVAAFAVFAISMGSNMNLGVRQVLSLYPLLAVAAGWAASYWLRAGFPKPRPAAVLVTALLAWQLLASAGAHSDYLPYFNELAGDMPEAIAVDSDLDWGQDLLRLSETLHRLEVDEVAIHYYGSQGIDLNTFNLPKWRELQPYQAEKGWVAVSLSALKFASSSGPDHPYGWLEAYSPLQRVGRSILLYYIP